jgi:copper chaperone CopZ
MKSLLTSFVTLVIFSVTALATTVATAATSVRVEVNGMVCAFCAQGIEKRMSKLPATKQVFVDLKKKVVAVEARDGQVLDLAVVSREIVDAGYDVVKIESVNLSVAEIKAGLKK